MDYLSSLDASPLSSTSPSRSRTVPSSQQEPSFATRYAAQTTYVDSLLAQLDEHVASHPSEMEVDDSAEPVLVHPPTFVGAAGAGRERKPLVQGPFLFQPAPRELEDEEVGLRATDIFLVDGRNGEGEGGQDDEESGEKEGVSSPRLGQVGILGIVFADGRVDICLEVEKLEALWVGRQETIQSNPVLAVYETVHLGLLHQAAAATSNANLVPSSSISSSPTSSSPLKTILAHSAPSFFLDPLYDDTVYVAHAFGVHGLGMRRWIDGLRSALSVEDKKGGERQGECEKALSEFFEKQIQTEVVRVIDTVAESHRFVCRLVSCL